MTADNFEGKCKTVNLKHFEGEQQITVKRVVHLNVCSCNTLYTIGTYSVSAGR